jgi:hypothetical protein
MPQYGRRLLRCGISVQPMSRLRRFEVDDQLVFGRRLHPQIGGLLALEDLAGIDAGLTLCFREVGTVNQSGSSVVPHLNFSVE